MRWSGVESPARFLADTGVTFPGVRRVFVAPQPAAATDWSVIVPGGVLWKISAANVTLTTSATVGNRTPNLKLTIDALTVWQAQASAQLAASQSATISFASGVTVSNLQGTGLNSIAPIPGILLPQGSVIASNTVGLAAADQWSQVNLYVEEYYLTQQLLTNIEEEREREYRAFMAQLAQLPENYGMGV